MLISVSVLDGDGRPTLAGARLALLDEGSPVAHTTVSPDGMATFHLPREPRRPAVRLEPPNGSRRTERRGPDPTRPCC